MVVAAPTATFGLPEALRGIYAGAGGPAGPAVPRRGAPRPCRPGPRSRVRAVRAG